MKCANCGRKVKANGVRMTFIPRGPGPAFQYYTCGGCAWAAHLDPEYLSELEVRILAKLQTRERCTAKGGQA